MKTDIAKILELSRKNFIIERKNKELKEKINRLNNLLMVDNLKKCSLNKSFNTCNFHADNKNGCYSCNHFE